MKFRQVTDSAEAAIGGGILSVILEGCHHYRIREVLCDDSQTGDEVEMFVRLAGKPTDVWVRLAVTEVEPDDHWTVRCHVEGCTWWYTTDDSEAHAQRRLLAHEMGHG